MNYDLLEDFSKEDNIDTKLENTIEEKPHIYIQTNKNNIGEKVVILTINIPLYKDSLKIDLVINKDLYTNIKNNFE